MYLPLVHLVVHAEIQADRFVRMQQQSLLETIEQDRRQNRTGPKVFGWLGTQMIAWGTKLQGFRNTDTGCQETLLKVSTITQSPPRHCH
jgi:hypothetical protein